jgi:hypothetical protein
VSETAAAARPQKPEIKENGENSYAHGNKVKWTSQGGHMAATVTAYRPIALILEKR